MKGKVFGIFGVLSFTLLFTSCSQDTIDYSAAESQLKEDLNGKTNEEVIDYVSEKSSASSTQIADAKSMNMSFKERLNLETINKDDFKGTTETVWLNIVADGSYVFNLDLGFKLLANFNFEYHTKEVSTTYNTVLSDENMSFSGSINATYNISEDTMYMLFSLETSAGNSTAKYSKKIKFPNMLSSMDINLPELGDTSSSGEVPAEYQEIISSVSELFAENKSLITYKIEEGQVKLCYTIEEDDILSLLNNEGIKSLLAKIPELPEHAIDNAISAFKNNNLIITGDANVGFNQNYIFSSLATNFKADYNDSLNKVKIEDSTALNFEFGNFSFVDVSDKDSYYEMSNSSIFF